MHTRRSRNLPTVVGFNMTPMIDIVFQLIIFFMLVTDMTAHRDDPVRLPAASTASVFTDMREIHITVMEDGQLRMSGRTLSDNALDNILQARTPGTPVLVRADRSTPFEHVQKILMMASEPDHVVSVRFAARKE